MKLPRGKRVVDDVGSENTIARTQWVIEGHTYNPYHPVRHTMPEMSTHHGLIPQMMNIL